MPDSHTVAAITGPAVIYALDADNPIGTPMRLRLKRGESVIVELFVPPYHGALVSQILSEENDHPRWFWSMPDHEGIFVLEGQTVTFECSPAPAGARVYALTVRLDCVRLPGRLMPDPQDDGPTIGVGDRMVDKTTKITDHEFDPGDHAYIEAGHLCHDCGEPLSKHVRANFQVSIGSSLERQLNALRAENERLRAVLQRIYDWDHMGTASDGAFWRAEIDKALGRDKCRYD